jgi:hypothetical protein
MATHSIPERDFLLRAFNTFAASRPQFWGDSLDVALAHPTKRIAIVMVAKRMQERGDTEEEEKTPKLIGKPMPLRVLPAHRIDFKSLAAGEKEDREDD